MSETYSASQKKVILDQLQTLAKSQEFAKSSRLMHFLDYIVKETLANRGGQVNQYSLALGIYSRDSSFDPATDSIVRVDAGRLRTKLREYYQKEGSLDPVKFELPKGMYIPIISLDSAISNDSYATNQYDPESWSDFHIRQNESLPGKFSIAVLPIESVSKNSEDDEIADGITTEIIDNLGRMTAIEVASRRSAFAYKGQYMDSRIVGKELNVDYMLEGSLRRAGNRTRIAVALIDASSNKQLWRESFDRELRDIIEFQEDIGQAVAASLAGSLWRAAVRGEQHVPPDHLNAAGLVHRAAQFIFNYSRNTFDEGEQLIQRALQLDPNSGHAHALAAFFHSHKIYSCWTEHRDQEREEAITAAERALELSPNDSWVLCFASEQLGWMGQVSRAVSLMEHALRLEPANPQNLIYLGAALIHAGQTEDGLARLDEAFHRSPKDHYSAPGHFFRGLGYAQLGKYEEAAEASLKGIEIIRGAPCIWMVYTNALAEIDRIDEAAGALRELRLLSPSLSIEHLDWAFNMAFQPKELVECHLSGLRSLDWPLLS